MIRKFLVVIAATAILVLGTAGAAGADPLIIADPPMDSCARLDASPLECLLLNALVALSTGSADFGSAG